MVRGDYVVGAVVFLILTLIQYIVVARGAERVAEVGARFTLDAMPGKQMAIDGDLRAGSLSPELARGRRAQLERESQFYGAMDGAMKFVKGDAIAGIAITAINLVAGVSIGTGTREQPLAEALQTYGLLTIGDGLVSQIPSLLIATAAGLLVTRVASKERPASLGSDIATQLFSDARVPQAAAGFMLVLALVPGLPAPPFLLVGGLCGLAAVVIGRVQRGSRGLPDGTTRTRLPSTSAVGIELGPRAAAELGQGSGALRRAVESVRESLFDELGITLPEVDVVLREQLPARHIRLTLSEVPVDDWDAGSGGAEELAKQVAARLAQRARQAADRVLSLQQVQSMLDQLAAQQPALVAASVPAVLPLSEFVELLRRLLREGVSIRPMAEILEAIARSSPGERRQVGRLSEAVRAALVHHISHGLAPQGRLAVHPVDPLLEEAVRDAIQTGERQAFLALPPELAAEIVAAATKLTGSSGVLVTQTDVRPHLQALLGTELPGVRVLSYQEIAPTLEIERLTSLQAG